MNLDLLAQQLPSGEWHVPQASEQEPAEPLPQPVRAALPVPEPLPEQPAATGDWHNVETHGWL